MNKETANAGENDFKQGPARKVNEQNFYLICQYLQKKIEKDKFIFNLDSYDSEVYEKLNNELVLFLERAPKVDTSKAYIEKEKSRIVKDINDITMRIKTDDYMYFRHKTKEKCQLARKRIREQLETNEAGYIKLTDEMMYQLHLFLVPIYDMYHKPLVSWVKQQKYREKKVTNQVTLSVDGKSALDSLKRKLGKKDFNSTLEELDRQTEYKVRM